MPRSDTTEAFGNSADLSHWHFYTFEQFSDAPLGFVLDPTIVFQTLGLGDPTQHVQCARQRFLELGWEGDGNISLIWIAPFSIDWMYTSANGTLVEGGFVWFVRQANDGRAFIASQRRLRTNARFSEATKICDSGEYPTSSHREGAARPPIFTKVGQTAAKSMGKYQ
jgi:hypothetical protein